MIEMFLLGSLHSQPLPKTTKLNDEPDPKLLPELRAQALQNIAKYQILPVKAHTKKGLCEGVWHDKLSGCCLTENHKILDTFGYRIPLTGEAEPSYKAYLYPEECVYLMDRAMLEMTRLGLPVSLQEGFNLLEQEGISKETYQAYSHLRRLGYILFRATEVGYFDLYMKNSKFSKSNRGTPLFKLKALPQSDTVDFSLLKVGDIPVLLALVSGGSIEWLQFNSWLYK